MAMFPFAPVQGPNGFPLPPGPGTVLARMEDALRETANDVIETISGGGAASGTNSSTVTSPSGAQGTATFDEHVVTVEEYNKGMEGLAKRIAKLSGQIAQLRTGMLTQQQGGSAQGWDGAMTWDQYQAQQGGGDTNMWMPVIMTLLLTRNGGGSGSSGGTGGSSGFDPTTLAMMMMMPNMGGGGGMGNGQMGMMMPLLLITLLKK